MNRNCKDEFIAWHKASFAGPQTTEQAWGDAIGAAWRQAWSLGKRDSQNQVTLWNMLDHLDYGNVVVNTAETAQQRIYNYYIKYGTVDGCIHIKNEDREKFRLFS